MGLNERAAVRMSTDEQRQFLESGRKLVLASHGRDGSIQLVVMHYGFLDDCLAFLTKRTSQKVSNFRRDPRASIIVHAGERYNELQGLCLAGRIQVIDEVDRVMEVARTMQLRYDEVKDPAKLERAMRNRVVLKFATSGPSLGITPRSGRHPGRTRRRLAATRRESPPTPRASPRT